jgi:hypothetical protein
MRRPALVLVVALNLIGAAVAVFGVWKANGTWEAVTAVGIALIAIGQFLERRLFPIGKMSRIWGQVPSEGDQG